jgi:ABC-type uncharacterized transport system substrate-binding protein
MRELRSKAAPRRRAILSLVIFFGVAIAAGQSAIGNAQPSGKVYRVGILEVATADATRVALWDVFRQQLRERGFIEGKNLHFEFRWANGRQERLSDLVSDFIRLKVDALVTAGTPAVAAASRATADIPIVMATGTLPTEGSANPPLNVVGVIDAPPGLSAKRLQLLREAVPRATSFAILAEIEHRLPSLSVRAEYAEAGILIAYGAPIRENYRQAALYVEQILKGAKPSELPVYEPTEFEFVINLKTAMAIGHTIPPPLLARAQAIGP